MRYHLILIIFLLTLSHPAAAEWTIITHTNIENNLETRVAHTENKDGYALEIYRDSSGAIRSRFSMNNNLNRLDDKTCPTYQIDKKRGFQNRSINDAPCISYRKWAEFVLGYIIDKEVTSTPLHNMMNGNTISYRFILENSGYGETTFSLAGSKRILTDVLGNDLQVNLESGAAN